MAWLVASPTRPGFLRALEQESNALPLGFVPWGDSLTTEQPARAHFSHPPAEPTTSLIKATSLEETERAHAPGSVWSDARALSAAQRLAPGCCSGLETVPDNGSRSCGATAARRASVRSDSPDLPTPARGRTAQGGHGRRGGARPAPARRPAPVRTRARHPGAGRGCRLR